jgi:hypothetical protein
MAMDNRWCRVAQRNRRTMPMPDCMPIALPFDTHECLTRLTNCVCFSGDPLEEDSSLIVTCLTWPQCASFNGAYEPEVSEVSLRGAR